MWRLSCFLLCLSLSAYAVPGKDTAQFYLDAYGRADPNKPLNRRVQDIFEKVRAVADKNHQRWPQLVMTNGPDKLLAVALPDGHIVLSQHAINQSYQDVSETEGDARIAFVLGHELAHLSNDDFWHQAFFSFAKDSPQLEKYLQTQSTEQLREKEINADDRGFVYAAMAGYPVDQLIVDSSKRNFFLTWQTQVQTQIESSHPPPADRMALIEARLTHLLDQLDYFYFGVRLGHFDRCEDALYFLKAFQQVFPGREVFNNLGYCHLQQARKLMGDAAYTYWLPGVLDVVTQAETLNFAANQTTRALEKPARPVEEALRQAQNFFTLATQADPYYLPAQLNLAVTWLYLDEVYQARAAIEAARKLAPDNAYVQGVRALILYQEGLAMDSWAGAMTLLRDLSKPADAPLPIVYNTARLLALRGRAEARPLWQRLAKHSTELPKPIREIVCRQQACTEKAAATDSATWKTPVKPGVYVKRDTQAQALMKDWSTLEFDWQMNLYGRILQPPDDSLSILEMSGYAEIVVLKDVDASLDDLHSRCVSGLRNSGENLWSCHNWTAWVVDEQVREVWLTESAGF